MKKAISLLTTATYAAYNSPFVMTSGPGIGMLDSTKSYKQFKPSKSGCLLKSIKTCSCDPPYRTETWQRQIGATQMRYFDCETVQWGSCRSNCVEHTFDSDPVSFTAAKYDYR